MPHNFAIDLDRLSHCIGQVVKLEWIDPKAQEYITLQQDRMHLL
jgi:hypothetical protein